jgi:hypothetical protein
MTGKGNKKKGYTLTDAYIVEVEKIFFKNKCIMM